jgi:hypothetical protein
VASESENSCNADLGSFAGIMLEFREQESGVSKLEDGGL